MKSHHGQKKAAVGQRSQYGAGGFLCFKPIGAEIDHVTDKALFNEDKEIKIDSSSGEKGSRRKGFARTVKEVLLRPKSRTRNLENRAGDGSCSFLLEKRSHDSVSENGLTKSSSMRSTTSSSSSSTFSCLSSHPSESTTTSVTSSSKSNPLNPKPPKQSSIKEESIFKKLSIVEEQSRCVKQRAGWNPIVVGAMLIVISLTLTILRGRLWAIGLNAVWLCSIPKPPFRRDLEERMMRECCSSVKQKRRVIMEGLLNGS